MSLNEDEMMAALQDFEAKFTQYANEVRPHFRKWVTEGIKPYAKATNALFRVYEVLRFVGEPPRLSAVPECVKILYAKVINDLYGVHLCLEKGSLSGGASILRDIFEDYVTILLLAEGDAARLRLYDDYGYVVEWQSLERHRRMVERGAETPEEFEDHFPAERQHEIEKNYEMVKKDYHPKKPYDWAWKIFAKGKPTAQNPRFSEKCRALSRREQDLDCMHAQLYGTLSIITHAGPHVRNLFIDGCTINIGPAFADLTGSVAQLSMILGSKCVKSVLSCWVSGDYANVVGVYLGR